jgi:hypothetical protein
MAPVLMCLDVVAYNHFGTGKESISEDNVVGDGWQRVVQLNTE